MSLFPGNNSLRLYQRRKKWTLRVSFASMSCRADLRDIKINLSNTGGSSCLSETIKHLLLWIFPSLQKIHPLRKNLNVLKNRNVFCCICNILPLCSKQMGLWVCSLNVAQKVLFKIPLAKSNYIYNMSVTLQH